MIKLLAVTFALLVSNALAIKVSVKFSACENHMPDDLASNLKLDSCLLLHYPETDNKDVALLYGGYSSKGIYQWNTAIGRSSGSRLNVRSEEDKLHLTFRNVATGMEHKIENLEDGQVFDVNNEAIAEDSKSMTLEEFKRAFDDIANEDQDGIHLDARAACGDVSGYGLAGFCDYFLRFGGCGPSNPFAMSNCRGTCGLCPPEPTTVKPQTTYKMTTTYKPTTYKMTTTYKPTTYKMTTTYKKTTYKMTTTYKPTTYKMTTTYKPTTYKMTTTYKPTTYKMTTTYKPTTYKMTTTYKPTTYKMTTTYKPTTYKMTTTYKATTTYKMTTYKVTTPVPTTKATTTCTTLPRETTTCTTPIINIGNPPPRL